MKKAVAYLIPFIEEEKSRDPTTAVQTNGKIVMATVKGDVHDIGKNIVGVVLQCNNYEVVDLGVMVSCAKILETARKENADIIGLSGLITPSLEEMSYVAKEMEREGFEIPLLIGGATTSKVHTAVKIAPGYSNSTIYVPDASRAVGVASNLISQKLRYDYGAEIKTEYEKMREVHERQQQTKIRQSITAARSNRTIIDWTAYTPEKPPTMGLKVFNNYDLNLLTRTIDWTPFFKTWELAGRYPTIMDDPIIGVEAQKLFNDAQEMLKQIIREKWLTARAVIGFWPANAVGDDIELYEDDSRQKVTLTLHTLRQQMQRDRSRKDIRPNAALADFVAPKDTGVPDYLGGFAVTAGLQIEEKLADFQRDHDDYSSILLKALADRLSESFAEHMHERVRKEFWAYNPNEKFTNDELVEEKYRGIRPAPGYPACPDHTEKESLWKILDVEKNTGIKLTDSFAMLPTASVSGFYFAHPLATYFGVGKIGKDQVKDYAHRKDMTIEEVERWLSPNLNYDPAAID